MVPIVLLLVAAWSRRWTADDGFINFRVVDQILAGNGPVFNDGERVEVATSPAWIVVLVVFSRLLFFLRLEWVAVVVSLGLAAAALAMAAAGAARLHGTSDSDSDSDCDRGRNVGPVLVPVGLVAFIAVRPVWDFTTSGLEVSLSLAWLAGSFWALSRAATNDPRNPPANPTFPTAVLLGLGPLVRPDFAVFSAVFLVALVAVTMPSLKRATAILAAALALPLAFQLFRMGYYGAFVPNTAFAKEASKSNWGQGAYYAKDFVGTYGIYVPLVLAATAAAAAATTRRRTRQTVIAAAAFPFAAAVHWLYVIRVGGDFMHGRLLLPGLFATLLPVAVVPLQRVTAIAAVGTIAWAVTAAATLGPGYGDGIRGPRGLADERAAYVDAAQREDPVTIDDYKAFTWPRYADIANDSADRGERVMFVGDDSFTHGVDGVNRLPLRPDGPQTVVVFDYVGMISYAAGSDVWIVDRLGLGDPLASRIALTRRARPGHEKQLHLAWPIARFAADHVRPADPTLARQIDAARQALQCGPIDRILDAATEPLTAGRFFANFGVALTTYGARISGNPEADAAAFCRGP